MTPSLKQTISLLERTPAGLNALLRGLPEPWTSGNEGEGTFSIPDVIGHLTYADRVNWMPRVRRILESGESKPFDPFDRWGHVDPCRGQSLEMLLDQFAAVRSQALDDLRGLDLNPAQLQLCGLHPSLGPVSLSELLATWAAHDLTHLHQISRILAHPYRTGVGAFAGFLGVLKCQAHGG